MATVETPDGKTIEVTSSGALRYYRREPGYKILDEESAEAVEEQPTSGRGRRQAPADVSAEAPQTDAVEPVTT